MSSAEIVTIIIASISAITSIAVALITATIKAKVAVVEQKVDDNTVVTNQVKQQTDGMKTELVQTTKLLAEAVGDKAGRAALKQEMKEEASTHQPLKESNEPVKVEVVNTPLKVISKEEKKEEK